MSTAPVSLLVTVDVECDKGKDWRSAAPATFSAVTRAIPERLHTLCREYGIRPTYLVSPEVLCDPASVAALGELGDCELGTHLHGDYVEPRREHVAIAGTLTDDMQLEYSRELEHDKLATLTELFRQRFGKRPRAFRAGRFGAGPHTAGILQALGYRTDSSVTPHVLWTRKNGERSPDWRGAPEQPFFVAEGGDLLTRGTSPLLEIPVTILPDEGGGPAWFRPWYSDPDVLCSIVDRVCAEPPRDGIRRPLVMMFHNVELVAGASPYPQDEAEVLRFLATLERVFRRALAKGVVPRTMDEYHASCLPAQARTWRRVGVETAERWPREHGLEVARTQATLAEHGAPSWFSGVAGAYAARTDLRFAYGMVADLVAKDAAVLDVGCGAALNLCRLGKLGFRDLSGFDVDPHVIAAGREIARDEHVAVRLWVDDGLAPQGIPDRRYAAITSLNWMHLVEGFSLDAFLERYLGWLAPDGVLVFDYVDRAYESNPNHRWLTWDWNKPVAERRPSEFRTRLTLEEIRDTLAAHGLEPEVAQADAGPVPRGVVVARRRIPADLARVPASARTLPRVLALVDAPGWAHDHKTENLKRCLADRFAITKRYQSELQVSELAHADIVLVWYWQQLVPMPHLVGALATGRARTIFGICSHNELEGPLREPGLAVLRRLPHAIVVHSELLYAEWRNAFGKPVHLAPNGVDTTFFTPAPTPTGSRLRVGWAGSRSNFGGELRGLPNVIEPAIAATPGVELLTATREERMRDREEMREFYRSLDVYVCASRVEGTPNPCLEAAACGVPLVTTRVGNMPELVVDGRNGFFIGRDPQDLSAKLALLRDRPELRRNLARNIREDILAWDWKPRSEAYATLFENVLAGTHDAVPVQSVAR